MTVETKAAVVAGGGGDRLAVMVRILARMPTRLSLATRLTMRSQARISHHLHALIHVYNSCLPSLVIVLLIAVSLMFLVMLHFLTAPSLLHMRLVVLHLPVKLGVVFLLFLLLLARSPGGQP